MNPLVSEIQAATCAYFGLTRRVLMARSGPRSAEHRPRQVAMYLGRRLTRMSFPELGRRFGGRDHSTVIHSVRKVRQLIATDDILARDVRSIRFSLEGCGDGVSGD